MAVAIQLDGRVAIVTGAGAGIGLASAETLAAAGAAVVVSDRDPSAAQAVADAIRARGGEAIAQPCDVTDEAALAALTDAAIARFGRLDILVNNAGGGGPKPFDMPMSDFDWAYRLNVYSVFRLCQLAAPHMQAEGGGAIVNISSMAGENRNKRMASYGSSKAAVNHLTRNIAFDIGHMGIRVNAVAPGAIRTAALASVLTPEIETAMLRQTPLGRLGEASDIANAVLFLARRSGWISGQVLTVTAVGCRNWIEDAPRARMVHLDRDARHHFLRGERDDRGAREAAFVLWRLSLRRGRRTRRRYAARPAAWARGPALLLGGAPLLHRRDLCDAMAYSQLDLARAVISPTRPRDQGERGSCGDGLARRARRGQGLRHPWPR